MYFLLFFLASLLRFADHFIEFEGKNDSFLHSLQQMIRISLCLSLTLPPCLSLSPCLSHSPPVSLDLPLSLCLKSIQSFINTPLGVSRCRFSFREGDKSLSGARWPSWREQKGSLAQSTLGCIIFRGVSNRAERLMQRNVNQVQHCWKETQ